MFVNSSYGSPFLNSQTGNITGPFSLMNHQEALISDYFNNLVLCERIWSPVDPISINAEASRNLQNPVAHSTPRAIKKTIKKKPSFEENLFISNRIYMNGFLRQKNNDNKQMKPKSIRKNSTKSSLESSINSISSFSTSLSKKKLPLRSQGIDLSEFLKKKTEGSSLFESSSYGNETSFSKYKCKDKVNIKDRCLFCENNGEAEEIYMSHPLKDALGKVVCPILRSYTCPKCGESGDYAHTNKYCPETQRRQKESKIKKFLNLKD